MRGLAAFVVLLLAVTASAQGPRTMTKKGTRPSRRNDNTDVGLPSGADVPDGRRMPPAAPAAPPAGGPPPPAAPAAARPPPPAAGPPPPAAPVAARPPPPAAPVAARPRPPAARPAPPAAGPPPPSAPVAARPPPPAAPVAARPPPPAARPAPMAAAPPPARRPVPRRGDNTDRGLPSGADVPDGRRLPPTQTKKGRRPARLSAPGPAYNVVPAAGGRPLAAGRPAAALPAARPAPMFADPWAAFFNPAPPVPVAPTAPAPMVPLGGLSCEDTCPYKISYVCSVYGNSYDNKCRLTCSGEPYGCEGQCPCEEPKSAPPLPSDPYPLAGFFAPAPSCNCNPFEYDPVCSTDGDHYDNECLARCDGATVACSSTCPC